MIIGLIILAVGILALLERLGAITGSVWGYAWPIILVIVGLWFIFGRRRGRWGRWCCGGPDEGEKKR